MRRHTELLPPWLPMSPSWIGTFARGQVTVCVAEAEPTSPAICQTIEIPRTTPEVRDGHGIYPAIPLIFQR